MTNLIHNLKTSKWLLPLLLVTCFLYVLAAAMFGMYINMLVFGIIVGTSVFYLSYSFPRFNPIILVAVVYSTPLFVRMLNLYDVPYGILSEVLILLMIFTLILNGKISGWKTTIGIALFIWLVWHFVEVVNPAAPSRLSSLLSVRKTAFSIAIFFIVFSSVNSKADILLFFKGWFFIGLLAALYGLYQEFFGLPSFDDRWVNSYETIFHLLFTWGRLRKFSFFFSPTEFGVLMAYAGVASLIFFLQFNLKLVYKVACVTMSVISFWAMMYSGSRTASILIPVGMLIFALVSLKRSVWLTFAGFALIGTLLVLRPTSNASLFVMLTAFNTDDASMNVRLTNQKIIQAYVQGKPFGFGLGSTGASGRKYAAGSFISSIPPDSEYVRVAIEMGWIGLFIWCTILATIAANGVDTYFRTRDPVYRGILIVLISLLMMMLVAQYPQEMLSTLYLSLIIVAGLLAKIRTLTYQHRPEGNAPE